MSNDSNNSDSITSLSTLEKALQSARYNEAVILTIDDNNDTPREIVLVATLDETNGGIVWNNATTCTSSGTTVDEGIVRHLRCKRWVLPMLNDHRRNALYESAIRKTAGPFFAALGNNEIRVLDIGSGTGLLAMMAARYLSNCRIVSVEMASAMARLAKQTVASNGLDRVIEIREGHSCEDAFVPFDGQKAQLCTSELLESGLLGEGILPALRDAWKRHLSSCSIVIPQRARVYAQVLEGRSVIGHYCGPRRHAGDGVEVGLCADREGTVLLGAEEDGGGVLVPIHADAWLSPCPPGDAAGDGDGYTLGWGPSESSTNASHANRRVTVLSQPEMVLEFDFTSPNTLPPHTGRSASKDISAVASGTIHGVLFWWELDLWEGMTLSTEPVGLDDHYGSGEEDGKRLYWQDHWQQCLYVFGTSHEDCLRVEKGERFRLISSHDDFVISFRVEHVCNVNDDNDDNNDNDEVKPAKRAKIVLQSDKEGILSMTNNTKETANTNTSKAATVPKSTIPTPTIQIQKRTPNITPFRAYQLNDTNRTQTLISAIQHAYQTKTNELTKLHKNNSNNHNRTPSPSLLDLSDFNLCALIAAIHCQATHITSLESSTGAIPLLSATVAQIGNQLASEQIQIVRAHPEQFLLEHCSTDTNDGGVDICMAEPYYEALEGWHIPEALNYYYLLKALKKRGVVKENAISVPSFASIVGCGIEFHPCVASAYRGFANDKTTGEKEEEAEAVTSSSRKRPPAVCDFLHESVEEHANRYHEYDMAFSLHQYRWKRLTDTLEIARLQYNGGSGAVSTPTAAAGMMMMDGNGEWKHIPFLRSGTCHALVCWVDYGLRVGGDEDGMISFHNGRVDSDFVTLSTGDHCHKQAVRMLPRPVVIRGEDVGKKQFSVKGTFGGCENLEDHQLEVKVR